MTKVAINGFGRIGRLAFRQMFEAEGYEVVAIIQRTQSSLTVRRLPSMQSPMQLSFLGVS